MRIGIHGAAGRVGAHLVKSVLAKPELELAAALVSSRSPLAGTPVPGGSIAFRLSDAFATSDSCDVIIDFSTPAASLALQEVIGEKSIPVVIGTTGFSDEQDRLLTAYAAYRPLLVSANFARGFETFRRAAGSIARQVTGTTSVSETYHARKKNEPSGTSRLLADFIRQERSRATGVEAPEVPIIVHREGEVVGINEVHFDMGSAEILVRYRVHTLAAYAEGALIAAEWLVSQPRRCGRFSLADALQDN